MFSRKGLPFTRFIKKGTIYFFSIFLTFMLIGVLTTVSPTYRISLQLLTEWTNKVESATFLHLFGMENRAFHHATDLEQLPSISSTLFRLATHIKPNDVRSLLGNELPGFQIFDTKILLAGEGTDYTNLPIESAAPLEDILKERHAIINEDTEEGSDTKTDSPLTTGNKNVVFIYNTHNRESFLPALPDVSNVNLAFHHEANVTKLSERLEKALKTAGIGTVVDKTDHMQVLQEKGLKYPKSYQISRETVEVALSKHRDVVYVFDIHRDSQGYNKTTKNINGKKYAKIMFVVGAEHANYERNLQFATELHYLLEEKYPGISRGIFQKKGPGTNGIFNQDLSDHAILLEIGGVENTWDELNRTTDVFAEIFTEYYWDAEKVNKTIEVKK
ncbi:MAG TPA: stage II sporulation protein P [Cerasibacillus sp.]|uniref:stage II sporulation protein P n=1 Tax=Cerasibacillus sp. TaxID=2498711 RepID=UPI002F40BF2E